MSPAGWYPDARDPGLERYWDGNFWTDQTRPASVTGNQQQTPEWNAAPGNAPLSDLFDTPTPVQSNTPAGEHPVGDWTPSGWQSPPQDNPLLGTLRPETNDQPAGAPWQFPDNAVPGTDTAAARSPWNTTGRVVDREDGGIYHNGPQSWDREVDNNDNVEAEQSDRRRSARRSGRLSASRSGRGRRRRWVPRVAGMTLALFAVMVLMAENDRENTGNAGIGTSIPVTDNPLQDYTGSGITTDDLFAELDETDVTTDDVVVYPTTSPTPSVTPTVESSSTSGKGVPPLPGVLDPNLLPPDVVVSIFSLQGGLAVSYGDTNNIGVPGVNYEVRVISSRGVKVRNPAPDTFTVKGVSRTRCTVEVRTLLGGRRSNPTIVRCGE
jgi:hypothetical protein